MATREQLLAAANASSVRLLRLTELKDPLTRSMVDYWTRKKGERRMPRPTDMDPAGFAKYLPHLFLLQVDREPLELTFRLMGEAMIAAFGFNPSGRTLLSLNTELPHFGTMMHAFFAWVAMERRPAAAGGTLDMVGKGYNDYEAVYLPLSFDGEHTDRILAATVYYSNTERQSAYRPPPNSYSLAR